METPKKIISEQIERAGKARLAEWLDGELNATGLSKTARLARIRKIVDYLFHDKRSHPRNEAERIEEDARWQMAGEVQELLKQESGPKNQFRALRLFIGQI